MKQIARFKELLKLLSKGVYEKEHIIAIGENGALPPTLDGSIHPLLSLKSA